MSVVKTQVLIIGGGAAGLSSSLMLGELGIDTLLVERHAGTSIVPKAHILHSRTMEIFRQYSLEDVVRDEACPPENFRYTSWYSSLGGDESWDRKLLSSIPSWSAGALRPYYDEITPSMMSNLPQHLLEPVLRRRAEQINSTEKLRFNTELIVLEERSDGIRATVRDRLTGEETEIEADYAIAADGGKTVGAMLGVPMVGPAPFVDVISLTFDADISDYLQEDDSLIRLFLQPSPDGTVRRFSIVASGPAPWDRHCQHWRSGVIFPVGSEVGANYSEADAVRDLRDLCKLPDLELSNITMSHWLIESVVAERLSTDRVFLVGDSAHRHSPAGGLGLNTGIQDVHNLAWKLAAVLNGEAGDGLLASYDAERRPVASRRVEFATFSFFNHLSVAGGFGMSPGASLDHNRWVLDTLFSDTRDGETRQSQLTEMINTLRREFQHADIDLGFEYADSPVVVPDGSAAPPRDPTGHLYIPVARPGHRVPHAWFSNGGARVSTHDLVQPGRLVLIAGEQGGEWVAAAASAVELGAPLDVYRVSPDAVQEVDGLQDVDGAWAALRGHGERGAVLVRPDGHVAYRSNAEDDADPTASLTTALQTVLAKN
jgi:2,4-dichlorophenol 6-monooxygenase